MCVCSFSVAYCLGVVVLAALLQTPAAYWTGSGHSSGTVLNFLSRFLAPDATSLNDSLSQSVSLCSPSQLKLELSLLVQLCFAECKGCKETWRCRKATGRDCGSRVWSPPAPALGIPHRGWFLSVYGFSETLEIHDILWLNPLWMLNWNQKDFDFHLPRDRTL